MGILEKIESPADLKKLSLSELKFLSTEIRQFLIENVSQTGGHLASNLGVVELTVALHYVFNSPSDSFVFDVGHQSYVHKILTGRKNDFSSLRQFGGMSGFPKKTESPHDKFNSGHSSNSISVALGIAEANRLKNNDNYSIAVIGDGALTGGLAYEALNNAGRSKSNLIVILNDNEMSISHNVGSMTSYLNDLRTKQKYTDFKTNLKQTLSKSTVGQHIEKMLSKTKSGLKHFLLSDTLFEALGFTYIGPLDGHDLPTLCTVLERAKRLEKPVFIHTYTKKGKGYLFAEQAPNLYHGTGPFDPATPLKPSTSETFSKVAGDTILKMAKEDDSAVVISAAMAEPTGLLPFANAFPKRFFDVGISEAHAVTFSAGLADNGFFPVIAIYSTFLQRAYDSILQDLAQQSDLNALFCIDRAGLVGEDGETHHGVFDISYLSHIPDIKLYTPYSKEGLEAVIEFAMTEKKGLYAVRYPRGVAKNGDKPTDIYTPEQLREGKNVTVVSISAMTSVVKETEFDGDHFHLNAIKPVKTEEIISSLKKTKKLVTIEDNVLNGGMGQLLISALKKDGFSDFSHLAIGIDDAFVPQGKISDLLCSLNMDSASLKARIEEFIS